MTHYTMYLTIHSNNTQWGKKRKGSHLCIDASGCLLLSWPMTATRKGSHSLHICTMLASAVVTCDSKKKEPRCSSVWETLESVAKDKRQLLAKVLKVQMQVFASSFDVGGAFVDSFGNWVSSDCPNLPKHVIISDGKKVNFPLTNFVLPQNQYYAL